MFCKKCGFQLKDTARFCPKCGTANTPPPIPPQPSNFTPQPNNFAPQPSNFTPQPNNFAPQQNSSFSPNAQSIAVKTKKPLIIVGVGIVILIVIIIAFCIGFTGHGVGGGSKGGYRKATKAAEAALTAYYTGDAAAMMKLWPEEAKEYYEDAANLTEEQLQERMQSRMDNSRHKHDDVSVTVDDNSDPFNNIDVIQYVNSILDNYGITADDAIWFAECTLILDGEDQDEGNDVYVYKYNGRWYSLSPEQSFIG